MTGALPHALLSGLSAFIADRLGLHFPPERWPDLERGIISAARDFGFGDPESCINWLRSEPLSRSRIETLACHLTVGETYFFRHRGLFQLLETQILPGLVAERRRGGRRLRIWSAGCSTGEEPYSVAITLSRLIPDWQDWQITFLGTDINPRALRKASEGLYSHWSFRDAPPEIKESYFTAREAGLFALRPALRDRVFFSHLNLADDVYPSLTNNTVAMDIIFCRNVLMYFTPERAGRVVERLGRSLVEGGWLVVSPIEASFISSAPFVPLRFPEAVLFRKDSAGAAGKETVSSWLAREEPGSLPRVPGDWGAPAAPAAGESPQVGPLPAPEPLEVKTPATAEALPDPYAEALALYEQGCYGEAADRLFVSLSQNGEDVRTKAFLARVYANSGRLDEALAWCEKAIAGDRLNAASHYLRALILQEGSRLAEAVASLKRALYLDQQFALAHFALANLSRRQGLQQESERHFRNALAVLSQHQPGYILPESDGITAGRLAEIIRSTATAYAQGPV